MTKELLISLEDYDRIYRTVNSILVSEGADILASCFFFSMFGASILDRHYELDCSVRAGIAGYRYGPGRDDVLVFAELSEGEIRCTNNGFHAWIEVEGRLLDLMAPVFSRLTGGAPKMIQKNLDDMSQDLASMTRPGDFFLASSAEMTDSLFQEFSSKPAYSDLCLLAEQWYERPPCKMQRTLSISDQHGRIKAIPLVGEEVVAAW